MAYIEFYNTVVYPHQFRLTHDLSVESFGDGNLDNHEPEHLTGYTEDELNITELSNMHISHKANMVMNSTENSAPIFNNMYNKALHTALENDHNKQAPQSPSRTLESFMVKTHSFGNTENDDVFMKEDIIGQYSNNSYEQKDIPPSPSRMINKKNKLNKQRRSRRRLPDIPVTATSGSAPGTTLIPYEKVSSSSSNEELQCRSISPLDSADCTSPGGAAGASAAGASAAGQSLADELREADPGIKLHHVDSNDRIAVINIVYNDPDEEGDDESVTPAAAVSNGGGTAGPSSGDSRQEEGEEQFKRLSWDTDRDRCSVSTGDGSPMVRSLVQDSTNSAKSPFDFYDDSQFIDDSPQVFKSKYEDSPYTRQEVEEMETSSHQESTTSTTSSSLPSASSSSASASLVYSSAGNQATHRGCHKFIPRHKDEIFIEIGDPIFVECESDDLWCEGVNLRTGKRGIFPSAYATDLSFIAVQDDGGTHSMRFYLQFLGSIQVNYSRGTEVLQQAINKVAFHRRSTLNKQPPRQCLVEINEFGVRMTDATEGKKKVENWEKMTSKQRLMKALESQKENSGSSNHNHFFPLKNVSFCGFHSRNERYFAFITKHPVENKFACHVFLGEGSTQCVAEAVGVAFRRFYQQYMAFVHPTEDIYMED